MASGSVWQMIQDLDTAKRPAGTDKKPRMKRSSSFEENSIRPRSTSVSRGHTVGTYLERSHPIRRVASTTITQPEKVRVSRGKLNRQAMSMDVGDEDKDPSSGAWGKKTKLLAHQSFKIVGKKGWELLKKAGKKAGEILDEGENRDSEDEEENIKDSLSIDDVDDESSYYDALSGVDQASQDGNISSGSEIIHHQSPPIEISTLRPQSPIPIITADDDRDDVISKKTSNASASEAADDVMPLPSEAADDAFSPSPEANDYVMPLAAESLPNLRKIHVFDPECPVHGARARFHRTSSLHRRSEILPEGSTETLNYSVSEIEEFPILASQAYAAKLARKRKRTALTGDQKVRVKKEMTKIKSNLCTISLAFLFLFTAFHGLQNLQTSVNGDGGLGAISLGIVYLALSCSTLIVPPYMLNRLGCKLTLILSVSLYALYLLANFIPKWYSLIPASFLLGSAASCLLAAQYTYLTETGFRYAVLNVESHNVVIVRFFGIFFMIVNMGQVFGNLISATILTAEAKESGTLATMDSEVDRTCGHYFDGENLSENAGLNLKRPPGTAILAVVGAYFGCALVAMLILAMFLNTLKKDEDMLKQKPRFRLEVWHKTVETLRKPKPLLLIPLTIFNGMEQAFIAGEFTKAYVGCCLGISHIGYVMTSFGVADALCSLVFGPLIKMFGRMPLFMFGAVVDMLMIFTLLIWPPNPIDTPIFYVIAATWGMADAVWNTQINGLWAVLFSGNLEVAFANYRLWESIGFAISLFYTPFTATETKLYILLTVLLLGMLGYGLIEVWEPLEAYLLKVRYAGGELWNYYLKKNKKKEFPSIGIQEIASSEESLVENQGHIQLKPIQGFRERY